MLHNNKTLEWKPYYQRKFKLITKFDLWIYMRNQGKEDYFDKKSGKSKTRYYKLYPLSHYRYKRFLVQYIAAKESNFTIPNGAKELWQQFYDIFETPYKGSGI